MTINNNFEDVIKVMAMPGNPSPAPKPVKPPKGRSELKFMNCTG
jgi:hypothetical protein